MALLILIFSAAGIQLWSLLHRWRKIAELQLALDRCTGEAILKMQKNLNQVERSVHRYSALKAAAVVPGAGAAAITALKAEWMLQQGFEVEWRLESVRWTTTAYRCGGQISWATGYPSFPWRRDPPDPLGPGNLRWTVAASPEFELRLKGRTRSSAAQTSRKGDLLAVLSPSWNQKGPWQSRWIDPH